MCRRLITRPSVSNIYVTLQIVNCLTEIKKKLEFIAVLFTLVKFWKALIKIACDLLQLRCVVCSGSETSFVNLQLQEHETDLTHKFHN